MLTGSQRAEFQTRGLLRLDGFLPADRVAQARGVVLRILGQRGVRRDGAWHFEHLPEATGPAAGMGLVRNAGRSQACRELMTAELLAVIRALLDGQPVVPMVDAPQVLFTLPNAPCWTVPHCNWHLDMPRLPDRCVPGIQLFAFLDTVAPGGGGTLVVAGSHRLLNTGNRISSKDVKRQLRREAYFRDLMSAQCADRARFLHDPGHAGDVELQVVELHGHPGDLFLMDMRLLHSVAPNAARVPRIMLAHRFLLPSTWEAVFRAKGDERPAAE